MTATAPSPWIAGESTAYQKRNASTHNNRDHLAWCLHGVITPETRVLDIGGGDGHRSLPWSCKTWHVVDGHDQAVVLGASYERADLETWSVPDGYDLAIFGYVLHWLEPETSLRLLWQAAHRCRYVAIDDFYPDDPTDVPYAHLPGVITRKRRYDEILPSSCILHGAVKYPYNDQVGAEPCRAAYWSTDASR